MVKWCFSLLGYLSIGRLLGISEIERELNWDISIETCLVLFSFFSGIYTCSGDLYLDISGFPSISLVRDINQEIVVLISRYVVLS